MNSPNDARETANDLQNLLSRCSHGDQEAQRQMYERYHERIYRLMVRMAGLGEAADLTQQVFLQLLRKVDRYAGRSKFETWMYRVAVNEALQYLRKERRRTLPSLKEDPPSQQRENERSVHRDLLEQAFARIDPDLRAIFLLREAEGQSYSKIAEILQIPEGTVGSRLNRARQQLQHHLRELGWES